MSAAGPTTPFAPNGKRKLLTGSILEFRRNAVSVGQKTLTLQTCATLFFALAVSAMPASAEDCTVENPDQVLPRSGPTSAPTFALPSPPTDNDCQFYRSAWHAFLFVTDTAKDGKPAFLNYPKLRDVFPTAFPGAVFSSATGSALDLLVRNPEPILNVERRAVGARTVIDDGFNQAALVGIGTILVDRNRNPIFYSIHVNNQYKTFIEDNRLNDITHLLRDPKNDLDAVPTDLEFRPGSIEIKASWAIVENPND